MTDNTSSIEHPLFSILIANYNNGQYLQECLDSVFAQTYTNWEVIIVDDGSTDNSKDIYKNYLDHPKIQIYQNPENRGCGYTKRRCVEKAKGEICAFLDPDDTITNNAVVLMVNAHLKNPDTAMVYSPHYLCNEDLSEKKLNTRIGQILPGKSYFTDKTFVVSAFASFKRKNYDLTEGINPSLPRAVDQDLYYKLEETGSFQFIDSSLYFYRRHAGGISTGKNAIKAKYWHLFVMDDTYNRRTNTNFPHNITRKEKKKEWSKYYHWLAEQQTEEGRFIATIRSTMHTILLCPEKLVQKLKLIPLSLIYKSNRSKSITK